MTRDAIDPWAALAILESRLWEWEDIQQDVGRSDLRMYAEGKVSAYRDAIAQINLLFKN